jgi:peptidoglycan/xylan/chitin deacetylase (PgdA/CDA1 family)
MAGIWPDDIRCVALITFDVDGITSWLNRNPDFINYPSLLSMAEYGPSVATPRILDMLDAQGIPGSFYIPGYVAETHPDLVREIAGRGHEVAHHGYIHEPPATMTPEKEEEVLVKGIGILGELTGEAPVGYRSPSWELSPVSLDLLAKHNFQYDSSLMGDDAPYFVQGGDPPRNLVELPIHWLLDDAPHFAYAPSANRLGPMRNPDEVFDSWAAEFRGIYRYGRCFNLTMHPQYIGRPGRLLMLERLIEYIKTFPGVRFMRAVDVAQMWEEGA